MKVFSYVVDHDLGLRPDPYFKVCTLCGCKSNSPKKRNVEGLAVEGDWVIGTGGNGKQTAGHGRLIYAMKVDEKLTRWKYYTDSRFENKNPERPGGDFEKYGEFALVSRHFYYFGASAIVIPKRFKNFEKRGPGFRYVDPAEFNLFLEWLKKESKPGKHGEPCGKVFGKRKGSEQCKSCCSGSV